MILPVVLLVGIGTNLRMGIANYHDAMTVLGMNRIRAGYLELAPDLERFFVMGTTDDDAGLGLTMAVQPRTPMAVQMLASTPMLVTVVDAILAGSILALLALQLDGGVPLTIGLGIVGFVAMMAFFFWYASREIARVQAYLTPIFPRPPGPPTDGA